MTSDAGINDIPVSLSNDTSVWWSGDIFAAMRATLNADRAMEHFEAQAKGVGLTNHREDVSAWKESE